MLAFTKLAISSFVLLLAFLTSLASAAKALSNAQRRAARGVAPDPPARLNDPSRMRSECIAPTPHPPALDASFWY